MYIPINWEYKNPSFNQKIDEKRPHAFGIYGELLGAFQISCKPVTHHIEELIKTRKEIIQSSDSEKLVFSEMYNKIDNVEMYIFSCAVDDHYFLATYTITDRRIKLNSKYEEELNEVRKALSSIKFVKPNFRETVIANRRFELFMTSIAAVIDLMNKALEKECLIEYVALSANRIDALLRLSIILSEQIENKNDLIDTKYLFQGETDKHIMERTIYSLVLEKQIISKQIYDKLDALYKERNKVIHRYIITDIRTEDIKRIALIYYEVGQKIDQIISSLEQEQSEKKIGIHKNRNNLGKLEDSMLESLISNIRDKHGNIALDDILEKEIK